MHLWTSYFFLIKSLWGIFVAYHDPPSIKRRLNKPQKVFPAYYLCLDPTALQNGQRPEAVDLLVLFLIVSLGSIFRTQY